MSFGELLLISLVFYGLYFLIRLIILEILTPILRLIPAVRQPLKRLVARGRMRREIRSGTLFVEWMEAISATMERVTGSGAARSITFAIVAAAAILLMTLPIKQVSGGAVEDYTAFRAKMSQSMNTANLAEQMCVLENILAEIERQTGKPAFMVPASFNPYPMFPKDDTKFATLRADNEAGFVYNQQLRSGRRLMLKVADLPAEIRAPKGNASRIAIYAKDGNLTTEIASLAPESEANARYFEALTQYCGGKPAPGFAALRTLDAYRAIADHGRTRFLAAIDDAKSREAYFFVQQQLARAEIGLSFMFSIGAGFILLLATKMALNISRLLPARAWMPVNLSITLLVATLVALLSTFILSLWVPVARWTAPMIAAGLIAVAPQTDLEQRYQQHVNHTAGEAVALKAQVCAEIGDASPLSPVCQLVQAYLKPWDPATRTFDVKAIYPKAADVADKPGSALGIEIALKSPLAIAIAASPADGGSKIPDSFAVWSGFANSPVMYVILGPILLIAALGILCFVLLDTRRAIVRRVHRIVKPFRSEIASP